jgi:hypothetical protein
MSPQDTSPSTAKPPAFVFWVVWTGLFAGLGVIYAALRETGGPGSLPPDLPALAGFAGLVPLLLSAVVRWLLLPRCDEAAKAFPLFVVGAAMGEGCALLGLMLGGEHRDALFLLGLIGVGQFFPLFTRRYYAPVEADFRPRG